MSVSLSKEFRNLLEKTTLEARNLAESACQAALENLAVHEKDYRSHMNIEQRILRNRLRARGRAIGDERDERTGTQGIRHLTEHAAYEHWHRLLFTRFLTENNLLITDAENGSVPVTIEECEELAPEFGAKDGFGLACRFAGRTLPGVFRIDDPVLELPLALNYQVDLRRLLSKLPPDVFRADDSIGWTYQFWQAKRKDEVNISGKKIGADELAPVTQLFTEDYMVEFLLHNTLGAWWAGKLGPVEATTEEEARSQAALPARNGAPAITWNYLRFVQDEANKTWTPAAGIFEGWPKTANLITLIDPCMGSGHFLVFALPLLVRLRVEEEGANIQAAISAVLKDNIYGLELDERCTQIAAFNLALAAWKLGDYQALPSLNLACSGLAPSASEKEWVALAGNDERVGNGMARLYQLFKDAPVLGSLINPRTLVGNIFESDYYELAPLLDKALAREADDDATHELAVTAHGILKAAEILASQFTLVVTNVPYLGRGKQEELLKEYCAQFHVLAKADLATCFMERCLDFCKVAGTTALVTPQNWLFLYTYKHLREKVLKTRSLTCIVNIGEHGFESTQAAGAFTTLIVLTNYKPDNSLLFSGVEASFQNTVSEKEATLRLGTIFCTNQLEQLHNPDFRITLESINSLSLLQNYASSFQGIATGDYSHFGRVFWELPKISFLWDFQQSTVITTQYYGGREHIFLWERGQGELTSLEQARIQGLEAVGKMGVAVSQMRDLDCTLYTGQYFDNNTSAMVVIETKYWPAVWSFCSSPDFNEAVRRIDRKVSVTNATLVKIPFDLEYWQQIANEKYPNGLPEPHSDDPTQWLFDGCPRDSEQPLHVAVARLLGYQWPRQTGSSFPDCPALEPDGLENLADEDGIVCLSPLNREQPAAIRLRKLLTAALGIFNERDLIAKAGLKGSRSKILEDWLRDEFFEQHIKLFHERPFIWHLWDGRADGFHVLVNYHKLDHANLQKLTYSYLGNWIQQQSEDTKADKPGAAVRLGAAKSLQSKLTAILEGEAPLDIFVRWKPIKDQTIGWHPDMNDGIRQNIRPFIFAGDVGKRGAGVFRVIPLKLKDKDRGTEPHRKRSDYPWFWCEEEPGTDPAGGKEFVGSRWNNVHLTLARKQKAKNESA